MTKLTYFIAVLLLAYEKCNGHPLTIVGGNDANIEDYPYQVSMLLEGQHYCGGSILNKNYILTAAHCTFRASIRDVTIRVNSSIANHGGEIYEVSKINFHNKFDMNVFDYDISLLELSKPLSLGVGVQRIPLIARDAKILDGQTAVVTGWGLLSTNGTLPDHLQVVKVPVISTETCKNYYTTAPKILTERFFCAGDDGKDACQGDSGGPLVIDGVLAGITSWGDICGQKSTPGVYTKITEYFDYIEGIMNATAQM